MKVNHSVKTREGKISMLALGQYHALDEEGIENIVRNHLSVMLSYMSDEELDEKYQEQFAGTFWDLNGVEIKEEE
jgi:hypothetical protein